MERDERTLIKQVENAHHYAARTSTPGTDISTKGFPKKMGSCYDRWHESPCPYKHLEIDRKLVAIPPVA